MFRLRFGLFVFFGECDVTLFPVSRVLCQGDGGQRGVMGEVGPKGGTVSNINTTHKR